MAETHATIPSVPTPLSEMLFSDAAAIWLEQHSRYIKPRTILGYHEYFRALRLIFGAKIANTITIADVRHYQDERRKTAGNSKINQELSALHQVLAEAGCWAPIGVLYKTLPLSKVKAGHSLTPEEESRLREVAFTQPRWRLAGNCMIVMLSTTAGFGELRHLRRGDVDMDRRCIHIREGVKNDYRDRTVPLNTAAYASMIWIIKRWEDLGGIHEGQYILPHRPRSQGAPWVMNEPMTAIRTAFREIRKAAGLPHFRIYDCRTNAITKILRDPKVSPEVARQIAGHISQAMSQRYSIQLLDSKRAALDALEGNSHLPPEPTQVPPEPVPVQPAVAPPVSIDLTSASIRAMIDAEVQRLVAQALQGGQAAPAAGPTMPTSSASGPRLIKFSGKPK